MTGYSEVLEIAPDCLLDVLSEVKADVHGIASFLRFMAASEITCFDDDELGLISDNAFFAYRALNECIPLVEGLMNGGDA